MANPKKYQDKDGMDYLVSKLKALIDEKGGGFIEMTESIPVGDRKENTLYGLILVDFDGE